MNTTPHSTQDSHRPDTRRGVAAAEVLLFAANPLPTCKRLPLRNRWPDETLDEVLARPLELNKQRTEEKRPSGLVAEAAERSKKKISGKARGKRPKDAAGPMTLGEGT